MNLYTAYTRVYIYITVLEVCLWCVAWICFNSDKHNTLNETLNPFFSQKCCACPRSACGCLHLEIDPNVCFDYIHEHVRLWGCRKDTTSYHGERQEER